jgi:hypothetical protein
MSDTVSSLAYEEARSSVSSQISTLDGLRARAGTLLAAASLVTSFLGGQALTKPALEHGLVVRGEIGAEGWVAIGFFILVAMLTLGILWPYQWRFDMGATTILTGSDFDETQRDLAKYHEQNYDLNKAKLDRLFWFFRWACVFLAAETVAWLVDLGG